MELGVGSPGVKASWRRPSKEDMKYVCMIKLFYGLHKRHVQTLYL